MIITIAKHQSVLSASTLKQWFSTFFLCGPIFFWTDFEGPLLKFILMLWIKRQLQWNKKSINFFPSLAEEFWKLYACRIFKTVCLAVASLLFFCRLVSRKSIAHPLFHSYMTDTQIWPSDTFFSLYTICTIALRVRYGSVCFFICRRGPIFISPVRQSSRILPSGTLQRKQSYRNPSEQMFTTTLA